jgi:CheY-like chemotaxis protein
MSSPVQANPARILVVEDEALLLFSIADDLQDEGYEVLTATNADEAIALLVKHPEIQLIFTDIDMPGSMDGLKLSAMVRDRWPPVRIIVTSGKQRPGANLLPKDARFLPKPYTTAGVVATMRAELARGA